MKDEFTDDRFNFAKVVMRYAFREKPESYVAVEPELDLIAGINEEENRQKVVARQFNQLPEERKKAFIEYAEKQLKRSVK